MADYPLESLWYMFDVDFYDGRLCQSSTHICSKMLIGNVSNITFSVLATSHHFLALFTKLSRH